MDKLLNQFLAVAEAGTISGAAAALFVTQPTLTFNMRKLEESLGVELLQRSSRGVRLTAYGETVYENARLMRRLHDNMVTSLADQRLNTERGISIGSGYSWWTMFLKDMVIDYHREYPNAPVQVSLGNQYRCMDQLLSGDISMFLAHEIEGFGPGLDLGFIPMSTVYHAFFVRADHPLASGPRTMAEIDAFPHVSSSPRDSRHQRFLDAARRKAHVETVFYRAQFAFGSNSLAACVDYVCATDAVLRHTHIMRDALAERGLVEVKQAEPVREAVMGLYCLNEQRGEERIEDLIARVIKAAAAVLPPLK